MRHRQKPWTHLSALADGFAMDEFLFGSYYVCHGSKPMAPVLSRATRPLRALAAELS